MSTLDAPDFIHNNSGVDVIDSLGAPFFAIASFVTLLEATISLTYFGVSFSMSDIVWTVGGLELTWAWLTTTLVLAVVWATNEVGDYDQEWHRYIPVSMLVIHAMVLFPTGADLVTGSDLVGTIALMVMGAGYYLAAYY